MEDQETKEYTTITIISHFDVVEFQKQLEEFEANNSNYSIAKGVNLIPMPGKNGFNLMAYPYAYIEKRVNAEEWKQWKFNLSIMKA